MRKNLRIEGRLRHRALRLIASDSPRQGGRADGGWIFSGFERVKRSESGVTAARPFCGDMPDLALEVEFVRK